MSYVKFKSDGVVLTGRVIVVFQERVKVYVEGELFERIIPKTWVTEWVTPSTSGRRARSRRGLTGKRQSGHSGLRHGA